MAAGVTAFALALLMGQTDIMRVGLLVSILPLASAFSVSRTRFRLACLRSIEPGRVPIGDPATVTLRLENVSSLPTGLLLVEDHVPPDLGDRARFVVDRMAPRGIRSATFTVQPTARGRYAIGPLAVRLTDPFGFCELDRTFSTTHHLIVTPHVEPLSPLALRGDWNGSGDSRARSVAAAGEDDVAVREYRHGDELRRVHWRATAKTGALMVRREEQPWESRCTVLLDTRAKAYPGHGPTGAFEKAVSVSASVAIHLDQRGYAVRLITGSTPMITGSSHDDISGGGSDAEGQLLDALATVDATEALAFESIASTVRHGNEGMLIAVLGKLTPDDTDQLVRARHGMGRSIALVCAPEGWLDHRTRRQGADDLTAQTDHENCVALLRSAGWSVAAFSKVDAVADTWRMVQDSSLLTPTSMSSAAAVTATTTAASGA